MTHGERLEVELFPTLNGLTTIAIASGNGDEMSQIIDEALVQMDLREDQVFKAVTIMPSETGGNNGRALAFFSGDSGNNQRKLLWKQNIPALFPGPIERDDKKPLFTVKPTDDGGGNLIDNQLFVAHDNAGGTEYNVKVIGYIE